MRWFSLLFDLACIFVAGLLIAFLFSNYNSLQKNNQNEMLVEVIEEKMETSKESEIIEIEDKNESSIIEYYNEALVDTDAPVFSGMTMSSSGGPQILIYHTHTSETYVDDIGTVVDVGALLTDLLRAKGYNVIHDTTVNDLDYNNSYEQAYENVEKILKENPSIQCIIDVHRDSATKNMVVEDNGIEYAKLMLVVGTNVRLTNALWEDNLSFAKAIHINCMENIDEIIKPIYLSKNRYNQHLCQNSVIVEVGGLENTIFQALNATYVLADAIDSSLRGK